MIEVLLTFQLLPKMKNAIFFKLFWSAFVNCQTAEEDWVQILITVFYWSLSVQSTFPWLLDISPLLFQISLISEVNSL